MIQQCALILFIVLRINTCEHYSFYATHYVRSYMISSASIANVVILPTLSILLFQLLPKK